MTLQTIIIDNMEYYIFDKVKFNNSTYYVLSNCSNELDILIQKEIVKNNEIYITNLDSEEEFDSFFKFYHEKISR